MMRLLLLIILICPFSSFAADRSDGCGLGWQVMDGQTLVATSIRGTTNAFVPPTFGMTSGTLGCDQHSLAQKDIEAVNFAATNLDGVRSDMAIGQGEWLEGLARTMGCQDSAVGAFGQMTQKNFRIIFDNENASAKEVIIRVREQIGNDANLLLACS